MTPLTAQQLAAIKARANAATPGPWDRYPQYGAHFYANTTGEYLIGIGDLNFGDGEQADADEAFVRHAREDVDALLDEVRRLRANPTPPTVGRPLTDTERTMLRYALDQAQDQMLCVGDEFSEDDHNAIDSLRRLADEASQQDVHSCGNCEGIDPASCLMNPDRVDERPRCQHCGLPHDLTPSMELACASIRASIRDHHGDAAPEAEPPVHGESVAHLAGLHDDEPAVDARQDGAES